MELLISAMVTAMAAAVFTLVLNEVRQRFHQRTRVTVEILADTERTDPNIYAVVTNQGNTAITVVSLRIHTIDVNKLPIREPQKPKGRLRTQLLVMLVRPRQLLRNCHRVKWHNTIGKQAHDEYSIAIAERHDLITRGSTHRIKPHNQCSKPLLRNFLRFDSEGSLIIMPSCRLHNQRARIYGPIMQITRRGGFVTHMVPELDT